MKKINRHLMFTAAMIAIGAQLSAQAKLVMNGGIIVIDKGASLVLDNADNTAIVYNGSGYIQSEGADNKVIWTIGPGNENVYLVPFGNAAGYFPVQFNAGFGKGAGGQIVLSTYHTATWKNSDYLPKGVSNVITNGKDNSAQLIDRFWQVKPQGYVTKPTLRNLLFTYADPEYASPNIISEASIVAQRWNPDLQRWNDYVPLSTVNAIKNTVAVISIAGDKQYDWWSLISESKNAPVQLALFPNPVADFAIINSSIQVIDKKPIARLYEANGGLLQTFTLSSTNQQVNTSKLAAGSYQINITYDNQIQILRFIKN